MQLVSAEWQIGQLATISLLEYRQNPPRHNLGHLWYYRVAKRLEGGSTPSR